MKIGLVVYDGLDQTSGGYLYDRRVMDGLRKREHTVEVVSPQRNSYRRNLLDNVSKSLNRQVQHLAAEVDVLVEDELCHPSLIGPNLRIRAQSNRPPIVTIVHHLRSSESWCQHRVACYRFMEWAYLRTVDGCIYNSQTTKATVEQIRGGLPNTVARPGTDHISPDVSLEEIRERARQSGALEVLFIGSIIERKGLHTLVQALTDVDVPWSLTVVGDPTVNPEYTERVQRLIASNGVESQVDFTGHISDTQLHELLTEHQILAVPSQYEGYGIVYLEGMAFGLPAIATCSGGAREVVDNGESGILIPPEKPEPLRDTLEWLGTNRDQLAKLGETAQERFHKHPTWETAVDRIEQFLLQLHNTTG
ncbi:glycosyltransferase family 4 protein [Salinarchaeum sp. IM2453]|uniref:glycosyltransferase family 4 protein n=1 Tax=Salinarchaeum sp. IM2453 TaxID=2862870 RepID=UPI001C82B13D|nr:glycosyltransferase family 4 protein [Salinarchaeum sp. IM2453]QZA88218.1 glycosyltransferase family 4 protein [Salinarchaeum sp. IM2453]